MVPCGKTEVLMLLGALPHSSVLRDSRRRVGEEEDCTLELEANLTER